MSPISYILQSYNEISHTNHDMISKQSNNDSNQSQNNFRMIPERPQNDPVTISDRYRNDTNQECICYMFL